MSQILVRDINPETLALLKQRARRNRRSLQQEARLILEEAAERSSKSRDLNDFLEFTRRMREASGPQTTDSTDLIREDRDR